MVAHFDEAKMMQMNLSHKLMHLPSYACLSELYIHMARKQCSERTLVLLLQGRQEAEVTL